MATYNIANSFNTNLPMFGVVSFVQNFNTWRGKN